MNSPAPASPWAALLPATLAGTRRQSFVPLPGLMPALGSEADASEKQLLLTAATLKLVQRAGRWPRSGPTRPLPPAPPHERPPHERPPLGGAATALFRQVLATGDQTAVACYLAVLDAHGRCLPPQVLVPALALLNKEAVDDQFLPVEKQVGRLLSLHARAFGVRGIWLARHLGDCYPYLQPAVAVAEGAFRSLAAAPRERYRYWADLLEWCPSLGAQLMQRELPRETLDFQDNLLWYLWATDLSRHLPPAGTARLAELVARQAPPGWTRPYVVAEAAVQQPGNPAPERLWNRARQWLQYEPATEVSGAGQLHTTLFFLWKPAWAVDGITPRTETSKASDHRGSHYLGQHLALLPPSRWAAAWNLTLPELLALADASSQTNLLLTAWLRAAVNTRDLVAARALLAFLATWTAAEFDYSLSPALVPPVARLLPPAEQRTWLRQLLPPDPATPASPYWVHWLDALYPDLPGLLVEVLPTLRATLTHAPTVSAIGPDQQVRALLSRLPQRGEDGLRPAVLAALGPLQHSHPALAPLVTNLLTALAGREAFVASLNN